jgi:hypothetical protein
VVNLKEDLERLINIPVYYEGEAPKELPNEYFTISEDYTGDNLNADNEALEHYYEFTLKWYTNDAKRVNTGLLEAIALLKKENYLIEGTGYKNTTYQNTWFSRMVDVEKINYL